MELLLFPNTHKIWIRFHSMPKASTIHSLIFFDNATDNHKIKLLHAVFTTCGGTLKALVLISTLCQVSRHGSTIVMPKKNLKQGNVNLIPATAIQ